MPIKDPEKRRKYMRDYNKKRYESDPKHRAKILNRNHKNTEIYSEQRRQLIDDFRRNGCIVCKETTGCCLQAHHLNPSEKETTIAKAMSRRYSPTKLKNELDKCLCVCANCHFKIHAGIISV